jgi:hypothetical protein
VKLLLLVAVSAAIGCGGAGGNPSGTLDRYAAALERKDWSAAYDMMSESYRSKVPREEFARMMADSRAEVKETSRRLRGNRRIEQNAELRFGLGDTVRLINEDGRWRIASNPVLFYSHASPRDALRSFLRAYRLERWDVMLRFIPDSYREKMTVDTLRKQFSDDEVASMMNMLESNLDAEIDDKGNQARMPYGDRFEVAFVREDGLWKIDDLD